MKKLLATFVFILSICSFGFSQDFASEAEDLLLIENSNPKNEFLIGFDVSVLGIEPTFQWIHNDHLEMMGGISFIQYGSGFFIPEIEKIFVVTPIYDIGYRTKFVIPTTFFSVGGTIALPAVISDKNFGLIGILSVYFKLSKQFGKFEIGGKTYVPLLMGECHFGTETGCNGVLAFANWYCISGGLLFTTFEVKIHL